MLCLVNKIFSFWNEAKQYWNEMPIYFVLWTLWSRAQNYNRIRFYVVKRQFAENKLVINFYIIPSFAWANNNTTYNDPFVVSFVCITRRCEQKYKHILRETRWISLIMAYDIDSLAFSAQTTHCCQILGIYFWTNKCCSKSHIAHSKSNIKFPLKMIRRGQQHKQTYFVQYGEWDSTCLM